MADYTTLDVVKRRLSITDTTRDTDLHTAITAASRRIDSICDRNFGNSTGDRIFSTSTTIGESPYRTFRPIRRSRWAQTNTINIGDTTSATVVVTVGENPAATDWEDWPDDQQQWLEPLTPRPGWPRYRLASDYSWPGQYIKVTADWGWTAVPYEIQLATAMLAARLHRRVDSPLGVTAGNDEFGTLYVRKIDPDIATLVQNYVRPKATLISESIL